MHHKKPGGSCLLGPAWLAGYCSPRELRCSGTAWLTALLSLTWTGHHQEADGCVMRDLDALCLEESRDERHQQEEKEGSGAQHCIEGSHRQGIACEVSPVRGAYGSARCSKIIRLTKLRVCSASCLSQGGVIRRRILVWKERLGGIFDGKQATNIAAWACLLQTACVCLLPNSCGSRWAEHWGCDTN